MAHSLSPIAEEDEGGISSRRFPPRYPYCILVAFGGKMKIIRLLCSLQSCSRVWSFAARQRTSFQVPCELRRPGAVFNFLTVNPSSGQHTARLCCNQAIKDVHVLLLVSI